MKLIENEFCKLKSILTRDIKKEIVAFANTNGGRIYIGIDDQSNTLGIDDIDGTLQSLTGMINEGISPSLLEYAKIRTDKRDNKDIIVVEILSGPNKPYYLTDKGLRPNGVYVRHGASSIRASDEMIRRMIFENASLRFEEMVSKKQNLTFIYLNRKFEDNQISLDENKYKSLNIIDDKNKYTNLGFLLSDQCTYTIKCAIFSGTNKTEFRDRKEFTGSILKQVDDIFEYFELFNGIRGKINGLRRIDTRDYPEYSLREALLNAVIHRSYYFDSSIMSTLYDDRFEIISMGGLIDGLTMNDIFKGISITRNPNLARVFYRLGYVESFGTGIGRIMDSYSQFDKKPIFDTTENTFSITLPNMNYKEDSTNSNIVSPLLSQKNMIISYLKEFNRINRNDVEKLLNISKTRAYKILNEMLDENLITKEGIGRNTYYVLT